MNAKTYRINQKAARKKGALDMSPEKAALLCQRLQAHIICNWMIAAKAGENYILKPELEKAHNGPNLMDAAGWGAYLH